MSDFLSSFTPSSALGCLFFLISYLLTRSIYTSIKSALSIAIGLTGISLFIDLLTNTLGAATLQLATNLQSDLKIIDIGWNGSAPLAWGSVSGVIAIPIAVAVNVIMLLTKTTRVVNIDIWNVWHFAFTGAITHITTNNIIYTAVAIAIHAALSYKLGDIFAPVVSKYFNLPNIAIPHGSTAMFAVIAVVINDIMDKLQFSFETTNNNKLDQALQKINPMGSSMFLGAILGFMVGALSQLNFADILDLSIKTAFIVLVMPQVVRLVMEGLIPINTAIQNQLQTRFSSTNYLIGLDPALLLGDNKVIIIGILFIPITIAIAIALPGNQVLPFADLSTLGFFFAMSVGVHNGNVARALITGIITIAIVLTVATNLSVFVSTLADRQLLSSLDQGGFPITYILSHIFTDNINSGAAVACLVWMLCLSYTFYKYYSSPQEANQ